MGRHRLLVVVAALMGCTHAPSQGAASLQSPSAPPAAATGSADPDPTGIFIDSTKTTPRLDSAGSKIGEIGDYNVAPGEVVQLVARTTDSSPIAWRVLPTGTDAPPAASIDLNGRMTVISTGRIAVVASTPENRNRIGWIVFASVGSPPPATKIPLPAGATIAPSATMGDDSYRNTKVFSINNDQDWQTFWQNYLTFPGSNRPMPPSVDFLHHSIVAMQRDLVAYEREPVVTGLEQGQPPAVHVVVPAKANWRVEDPITGENIPAHMTVFELPKADTSSLRIDLDTPRWHTDMRLPRFGPALLRDPRPLGPIGVGF